MKVYFYTFILPINDTLTQHQLLTNSQRRRTSRIQPDRITELTWNPEVITEIAVQMQDKFKPVVQGT